MTAPIKVKNAVDLWVDQSTGKARSKSARLQLRAGSPNQRFAFIHFNPVWPDNAIILSAVLRLRNGDAIGTSTTLTAKSPSAKWDVNKITYANQPALLATSATVTKATATAADTWDIDVKALVSAAAAAGKFYGFRIESNNTAALWFHATEAEIGKYRPVLLIQWCEAPDAPDELSPSNGLKVSKQYPTLTYDYNDPMGDFAILSEQLQIGTSQANVDAGTVTYDSGEVTPPTAGPEIDTSLSDYSGWAGLVDGGANVWWRCRAKDALSATWSPWSLAVEMGRVSKGVLAFTSLTSITEGSPTIAWSLTGRTQAAYRLAVAYADTPDDWIYDSGHVTSTATSHTIPFGVIKDTTKQYVVTLRVWDNINRVGTPGDPAYTQVKSGNLSVTYDNTVTNLSSLSMTSDPLLPIASLNISYTGPADFFQILRSLDGGTTWVYVDEKLVTDVLVSGSNYLIKDTSAPTYQTVSWKVVPVAGGKQGVGLTVNGMVRRLAPFLLRTDGTDACCFLNPERDSKYSDLQTVQTTLNGNNVLTTQHLGKKTGSVKGLLTGSALNGVSADEMLKRFLRLRDDSGVLVVVATANETRKAIAYNFWYEVRTDAEGVYYEASFDWLVP